jgi:hypothetical protein
MLARNLVVGQISDGRVSDRHVDVTDDARKPESSAVRGGATACGVARRLVVPNVDSECDTDLGEAAAASRGPTDPTFFGTPAP